MVLLPAVSWPWVPACGSLEPSRQDGENAQKTGKNGGKMGEIRPKKCEGRELTKDQLVPRSRSRAPPTEPTCAGSRLRTPSTWRRTRAMMSSPCSSSSALESGTSGHAELREDEGCGGHEQEELGHRDPLLTAVLHLRVLRAPDQRAISADTMAEVLSVTQMTGES